MLIEIVFTGLCKLHRLALDKASLHLGDSKMLKHPVTAFPTLQLNCSFFWLDDGVTFVKFKT